MTPFRETVGVTGGAHDIVTCRGTLHMLLTNKNQCLMIQIKNVPCVESNPHYGFPLTPFYEYGFKKAMHSAREKVVLKDENGRKYDLRIANKKKRLRCTHLYSI